jgi:predicted permease
LLKNMENCGFSKKAVVPFFSDLRTAARALGRQRGFAAAAVLTLGLGLGTVTALFAVVQAVLLQPVASHQDRVIRVWKNDGAHDLPRHSFSYPEFTSLRDRSRAFDALAAINYADASTAIVTVRDLPAIVSLTPVSADFFRVLHDGPPLYGRWIQPRDELPGAELVAVISEAFWRRALGADPAAIGRRLTWAGSQRTVLLVGVAPRAIDYPLATDMWVPIARFFAGPGSFHFDIDNRRLAQFELLGRIAPGVSAEAARAELTALTRQLSAEFPGDYGPMPIVIEPILDTVVGDSRQMLLFLLAAAALVFVIAGVNVSALLLMRTAERRAEMTVRMALGASQARLTAQTIVESLLIGALGALCGLTLARLFLIGVARLAPGAVPHIDRAAMETSAVTFGLVGALVWVVALGTVPIWLQRRFAIQSGGGWSGASPRVARGTRGLRIFTIVEIGAAVFVAIAAGLLVRSFAHLQRLDRGFDSSGLTAVSLVLPESRYPDAAQRLALYEQLVPRVAAIPGVISTSPIHMGPGTGIVGLSAPMMFEGQTPQEAATNPWATWEPVMPSYFRTLGIRIVRGRSISPTDGRTDAPVAVVSEDVAQRYWPNQDPIGKRLRLGAEFPWVTVVGVARDVRYRELTKAWLTVYFPAEQFFFFAPGALLVRSTIPSDAIAPAVREAIRAQEPYAAIESIATMDALLAQELSRPRTALMVTGLFALMAIVLAGIGVYAVMSYDVRQRRRELAVRAAIGASPGRLLREVLSRSLALCAVGVAAGLFTAGAATRLLRTLLYETDPGDPRTFAIGATLLIVLVLLAAYGPARRAATADPVTILRGE